MFFLFQFPLPLCDLSALLKISDHKSPFEVDVEEDGTPRPAAREVEVEVEAVAMAPVSRALQRL